MAELLVPISPVLTGTALTSALVAAIATTGNKFANDGKKCLIVKNGSGSSVNVVIDSPATCNFNVAANAAHDVTVAVGAGLDKVIGPFPPERFNDANGFTWAVCSAVTDVTVGAI